MLKWLRRVENLNVLLAALNVLLVILAILVNTKTLSYMRSRDLEIDTRNGWIEIHKAMIDLEVQRSFVIGQRGQMGAYSQSSPNAYEERMRDFILAAAQLRAQLDRLNDDPMLRELSMFLNENSEAGQWQTEQYRIHFDDFAHRVALKARPQ